MVKGASKGEGLGNKFLSHIREVDAIIHMIRCFDSESIQNVNQNVDPIRDLEIVETEINLTKSINSCISNINEVLTHSIIMLDLILSIQLLYKKCWVLIYLTQRIFIQI